MTSARQWAGGILAGGLLVGACWFVLRPTPSRLVPDSATSAEPGAKPALPDGLFLATADETKDRVRRVFPNGPATQDAREEVGTAPPPPDPLIPDGAQSFVSEINPAAPVGGAQARAALPPSEADRIERRVEGRLVGSDEWMSVEDEEAEGKNFSRLAVVVDLVAVDTPVDAARLSKEVAWAGAFAAKLGAPAPTSSMSPGDAVAKARAAMAARKKFSDEDLDVGVAIVAAKGKPFPGKLVWDAVYSAGFTWGDGDYFHWVPSEQTDVSQGIGMGTTSGSSYFLPESLAASDGRADVDDLEMSFNAARCREPTKMFDVMSRAATYLARRLGGTVTGKQGVAFDPKAERARVVAIEQSLTAAGITPGSTLAIAVF